MTESGAIGRTPALLHGAYMALPYPLCVHDGTTFILVNHAAATLFGASSAEAVIGTRLDDHLHPDCVDGSRHRRRLIAETGHELHDVALKLITADGASRYCKAESWRLRGGPAPLLATAVLDHGEQQTVAPQDPPCDEGADALAFLALDSLPVHLCVHDQSTILFANARARDLLGARERADIEGAPLTRIVHRDAAEAGDERRRLLFGQGVPLHGLKFKLLTLTGRTLYARGSGRRFLADGLPHALVLLDEVLEPSA